MNVIALLSDIVYCLAIILICVISSRRRHTGCAAVTVFLTFPLPTYQFGADKEIDSSRIHGTSRSITRIRLNKPLAKHLDDLVESSNAYLNSYRLETGDVFLTSFKGLRKDGSYRRRLDFQTARTIISQQAKLVSGELVGS